MTTQTFKICVRKRPNKKGNYDNFIDMHRMNLTLHEPKINFKLQESIVRHNFKFDSLYDENTTNDDIFNGEIRQHLDTLHNYICYTYGETGSGKTHTIFGNEKLYGILDLTILHMLTKKNQLNISAFEIYGNKIFDLLNDKSHVDMWESAEGIYLNGLKNVSISEKTMDSIIGTIKKTKSMGKSSQNSNSSRSHTIIQLVTNHKQVIFVDLAGCEKASKSICTTKQQYYEMAAINKSILSLKECIRAMHNKDARIPFRGSKLTMILKSSFSDKYSSTMISTISPEEENIHETLNTLNYSLTLSNSYQPLNSLQIYKKETLPVISPGPAITMQTDKKVDIAIPVKSVKIRNVVTDSRLLLHRALKNTLLEEMKMYDEMTKQNTRNIVKYKKKLETLQIKKEGLIKRLYPQMY